MSSVKLRSSVKSLRDTERPKSSVSWKDDLDDNPKSDPHLKEEPEVVSGFTRFTRGIKGFWSTTEIADTDEDDRDSFVRVTIRELVIYLGYVIVICLVAFLMLDSTMYYLTKVMQGLFVDGPGFDGLKNEYEFWDYVENGLLDGLYKEQNYDGSDVHYTEIGYIFSENKLFGRPRLRQVRVRKNTCKIHPTMQKTIDVCYAYFSEEAESKVQLRPNNATAWNYRSAEQLEGRDFLGRRTTYGGGGYTQLLEESRAGSEKIISALKQNLWLDRGTSAVFIDFTVYNANINLFSIVKLLFEFTPTGGCVTFRKIITIKLLRYVTATDYFVMACEGILILYLIFYTVEEIIEMKKLKKKYFKNFWNFIDLWVILLGYAVVCINLYRTFKVGTVLKDILDNRTQFANFELLAYWQELFNDIVAVACFFSWIKIFKFISFNQTMAHLQGTLSRSAGDVAAFTVMFFLIFFSFAHWGVLCFGSQAKDFHVFYIACFTLFRIILGDFDFAALQAANRLWGPIYFVAYIFFVFFVLLNMFLAIINDTYAEVKEEMDEDDAVDVGQIFKKGYDKMVDDLNLKQNKVDDIRKALMAADTNNDNMIEYDEWRTELKARGHHDADIEAIFAKYDVDGDRILNEHERIKMMNDLEGQHADISEEINDVKARADPTKVLSKLALRNEDVEESSESEEEEDDSEREIGYEEYKMLFKRVDRAEQSVSSIVSKVESVLMKLEAMDQAKAKRRDTMSRLIESISEYEAKVEDAEEILAAESSSWGSKSSVKRNGSSTNSFGSRADSSLSRASPKQGKNPEEQSASDSFSAPVSKGSSASVNVSN
ncbi:polycystin-2-like [Hydractinia symbiolongicarpus]|uniref:polycystin-2-like n=1 Tax=Hydractinia symbiolongicarpus TaxID=13093 RepID=UPI00254FC252|nr:polycystin-2-like [Hydractinia symbiolongicarpus]XP_057314436.1 polycystin-2-like [Hydractinia symbiolongicarpus]XP_057314437.1 polycystin-2-like [Hydractinia symbiolongicarpus]XP_057314438.1 polycystin-2-like [Hydractinia symbiolongicarpus]XP_057314439.1 polycystin-2-like [Hydractinia symbiolongicarpus]